MYLEIVIYTMIQRIQTIYLAVVVILASVAPLMIGLWLDTEGNEVFAKSETVISVLFYVSAVLAFITIFIYKNRQNQFVTNRLNIILNLFLLGFFLYQSLNLSIETVVSEKSIGMFIPVLSIIFLVIANKSIKKDEDIVKSVDRLR